MSKVNTSYVIVLKDMPVQHVRMIAEWASVLRTLKAASSLLNKMPEFIPIEEKNANIVDEIDYITDELNDIGPALDWLHHIVRGQMWEQKWKGERDA